MGSNESIATNFSTQKLMQNYLNPKNCWGEDSLNCLLDVYRMENFRLALIYVTQKYTDGARAKSVQY